MPFLIGARGSTREHGATAAKAILTTDTKIKEVVVEAEGFVVGGMAKGAAMLAPNMATMLAILTTDASSPSHVLGSALKSAVMHSFNEMTVDGCRSTNDSVIVMASGRGPVAMPRVPRRSSGSTSSGPPTPTRPAALLGALPRASSSRVLGTARIRTGEGSSASSGPRARRSIPIGSRSRTAL